MYQFLLISPPQFDINKKAVRTRSNCPVILEEWIFLDHTSYGFVDEVVMKIFVYLLITNTSLYENILNPFEHVMETQILFKLIKQPLKNFLVFSGRR